VPPNRPRVVSTYRGGPFASAFAKVDTADAEPAGEFPLRGQPGFQRARTPQLDALQQPLDGSRSITRTNPRTPPRDGGRPPGTVLNLLINPSSRLGTVIAEKTDHSASTVPYGVGGSLTRRADRTAGR